MNDASSETINLTPSPEILEVIAEVDLQVYHCLAELVDNGLDELKQAAELDGSFEPRIDITIPTGNVTRSSSVIVSDNGRGMSVGALESALRAGSSGKQMLGSLGMFGMGFNIASTRLGSLTEVRTGRAGDGEWVIASIDIRRMIEERSYEIPIRRQPKAHSEFGTQVRITHLKDDIVTKLSSGRAKFDITSRLGRIYTYLLRDPNGGHSGAALLGGENIRIYVNGSPVRPVIPCIWDPSRTVAYKGAVVPAAAPIDFTLGDAYACMDCGRLFTSPHDECTSCGGFDIQVRERRIWGWVGVQRYTDNSDFGFSFFRQGRCLIDRDKQLFDWQTPDGTWETEYPVEIGGGRIVGEIHMDFAKPQVRKTDFDRESREWQDMRELVRGYEPLRPNIARARGYQENSSPLSRYFNAFRRNDPGVKLLVPGNGKTATPELAREWGKNFREGDPEYLTDEKWFAASEEHDRLKNKPEVSDGADSEPSQDDWFEKEGLGGLGETQPEGDKAAEEPAPIPETDDARFARYRESARLLTETNKPVMIDKVKATLRVYVTEGVQLLNEGEPSDYAVRLVDGEVEVYVDDRGRLVRDFGWNHLDTALMSASQSLKQIYRYPRETKQLILDLLEQFPDRKINAVAVRNRSEALMDAIRDRLAATVTTDPEAFWSALSADARRSAENTAVAIASDVDWIASVESGDFVRSLDARAIQDLVVGRPDLVFDGRLFRTTYDGLGPHAQAEQIARIAGLVADLQRMPSATPNTRALELQRFLAGAELLDLEIVTT